MERVPVGSSNIAAIGYDAQTQTLAVEFRNSKLWYYTPVSPEVHLELMQSDSIGRSFYALVKSDPNVVATDVTFGEPSEVR